MKRVHGFFVLCVFVVFAVFILTVPGVFLGRYNEGEGFASATTQYTFEKVN